MDAREANILVHTRMAASYNEREPHFRPENRAKVRAVLERMRSTFGGRLLDVGCGTGFVIDLAAGLFDEIDGVDITPAMLARVDTSRGKIRVQEGDASHLPFDSETFDVVSAYSFIHHLEDPASVVREMARVLRHGGGLYIDLEPNRYFWENVTAVKSGVDQQASRLVVDEVQSVCHTDDRVAEEFSIPQEVFNLAEYNKALTGGINPDEFVAMARGCGFEEVTVNYQWFAGQGKVLHGISAQAAETVDSYLRSALPLSRGLYKYLQFLAVKA